MQSFQFATAGSGACQRSLLDADMRMSSNCVNDCARSVLLTRVHCQLMVTCSC
jgi:hypothetical protein